MADRVLFTPFSFQGLTLPNRVVMAPMTRCRAGEGNVPTALNARYYAQRASAGLIVTEATQVAPEGVGYARTPAVWSCGEGRAVAPASPQPARRGP